MLVLPERVTELNTEIKSKLKSCRKLPVVIRATQMNTEFQVETLEGNYKTGKAGDYLMVGIDGEMYICDKEIFEKTYDWVNDYV